MTFTLTQPAEGAAEYQTLMGLVGTLKGLTNWSAPIDHVGFDSDARFAAIFRNLGTGGALKVLDSAGSNLVLISDGGMTVTSLSTSGNLGVGAVLTVTGASNLNGAVTVDDTLHGTGAVDFDATLNVDGATTVTTLTASSTVQGTRLISTVATGTAPLTVSSATKVTSLNADLLDGMDATEFLTPAQGDAAYVNATGDTMTGLLTIEIGGGGNDQAIKFKHNAGAGGYFIGASNAADPVLVFKDNSGDQVVTIGNNSSLLQLDVTGDGQVSDNWTVGGDLVADSVSAGGGTLPSGGAFRMAQEGFLHSRGSTGDTSVIGINSGDNLIVGQGSVINQTRIEATNATRLYAGGNLNLEDDVSGGQPRLGFFDETPVERPLVTGVLSGSPTTAQLTVVVRSILAALDQTELGLVIDATS